MNYRRLEDTCWDEEDVLAMCADAELNRQLDDYAQRFVDDIRAKVGRWGISMFMSDKQEVFLMTIADAGLRDERRRRERPTWIKRAEGDQ